MGEEARDRGGDAVPCGDERSAEGIFQKLLAGDLHRVCERLDGFFFSVAIELEAVDGGVGVETLRWCPRRSADSWPRGCGTNPRKG